MTNSFEDAAGIGQSMMDSGLKSMAAMSTGLQAIASEATDYSRQAMADGGAALEGILSAKSPEKALEIQSGFAREAYEGFVAQATRMSELYAELAKDVYKPFESLVAKAD